MTLQSAEHVLLRVDDLRTHFPTRSGTVAAVAGVDLEVRSGEIVGLVGESGSGKSLTAYSILGLVPKPGHIVSGDIRFKGVALRQLSNKQMRQMRGARISMVFQEPLSALNPVFKIGVQLADVLREHTDLRGRQLGRRIHELLDHVGIAAPEHVARSYPFQLSGGMRQRALIAMAIACRPQLLIADEPTTALDTTVQAQIMDLLKRLVREDGLSILLITHDLGIVAQMCQRVYVMYAGKIVESGLVKPLFLEPKHPYTSALLGCIPRLKPPASLLQAIEGTVPTVLDDFKGCTFTDRCPHSQDRCRVEEPPLRPVDNGQHRSACHFADALTLGGIESLKGISSEEQVV